MDKEKNTPTPESVWAFIQEMARKQAERDAALDARIDKLGREIGGIANNNGYSAEEHFYSALAATMTFAGVKYDTITPNVKAQRGKVQGEFDIMMLNGSAVALIEVKHRAHQNIFENSTLPTKKVQSFKTLFPAYANHKIYLGIAAMSFNDEVLRQARELGIGIIKQQGDSIEFDTDYVKAY